MGVWKCSVCGYVFDEEKEGMPYSELKECPVCKQPASVFEQCPETEAQTAKSPTAKSPTAESQTANPLEYPAAYAR